MASKINVTPGTAVIFADAGFTGEDVEISLTSLADTVGRLSARHDLVITTRAARITVFAEFQCVATPTLGDIIKVYVAWHDEAGNAMGGVGTVDAALTQVKTGNLDFIGRAKVDAAAADTIFTMGPVILETKGRYISLGVINDAGSALTADDAENFLYVYPFPLENQ